MNILQKAFLIHKLNKQFYHWDRRKLQLHQEQRLTELLQFIGKHSPFYHELSSRRSRLEFHELPVINKAIMMEFFDRINTVGLKREELTAFKIREEKADNLGLFNGEYSVGLSSGTTGNKGLTILSREEQEAYSCLLFARSGIPSAVKKRRIFFALRTNNPAFAEITRFGITMIHVDYTHPLKYYIDLINNKRLNILAGPPSLLHMIAKNRNQIYHRIETLISYAEVLEPEVRRELELAFNAPVIQIYQGAEGFIGSTCKEGRLHINEDTILVEEKDVQDPSGRVKSLIITDLYRKTQPIIRYAMNDLVELEDTPCPCGSSFRVIRFIHGRCDHLFFLQGADGNILYLFPDYIRRSINQASDEIIEYQVFQHSISSTEVRLTLKEGADRASIEKTIGQNLSFWTNKIGGDLGEVTFNAKPPEKNQQSQKFIRVVRLF